MNNNTKNEGNKIKNWELDNRITINTLEKKPRRGGTPAKESKVRERAFVKKLLWLSVLNESKVSVWAFANWRNVVKKIKEVKLYITKYVNTNTITWNES